MADTQNKNVLRLVESGLLVAIGILLDTFLKFEAPWAYGGSITLFSMLPLVIIAYKYGVCWGCFAGLAHGLIGLLISGGGASGLAAMVQENGPAVFAGILLLDYILAFSSIGIGGVAAKFAKSPSSALGIGAVIGLSCRFFCHFLSGYLLFGSYAEWFFEQSSWGMWILDHCSGTLLSIVYSLVYNGLYMVPEIIITAVGGVLAGRFLGKQLQHNRTNLSKAS